MLFAKVKTQFEALHYWPDAPNFLRNPHRHIFHVEVMVEQKHTDRDIEYFKFKHFLEAEIKERFAGKKFKLSCEDIAVDIKDFVMDKYRDRKIIVEVNEDGENGAVIM